MKQKILFSENPDLKQPSFFNREKVYNSPLQFKN